MIVSNELLQSALIEDFPEEWRFFIEIVGVKNTLEVIAGLDSCCLRSPVKNIIKKIRNRHIVESFYKSSVRELTKEYGISPSCVYRIKRSLEK